MTFQPAIYILAHDIRSLYNIGSLFRLCDGAGVTKLFLTGISGAPFDRLKYRRQRSQIAKTALEGLDSVDWEYAKDPFQIISQLRQQGVTIVALELTDSSQSLHQASFTQSLCLVLGNETSGVSPQLLAASDAVVHLPMHGQGKSLNVVTATAAALYLIEDRLSQTPSAKTAA